MKPMTQVSRFYAGIFLVVLISFISFSSCSRMPYPPSEATQTGEASWYGPDFHGKLTSSKEIYDMYDMTAAHNSLPFGTYVVVTNLINGKSAVVRINDRGPFVKDRIIDLSYAAALALDMVGPGTAPVKLEVLPAYSPEYTSQKFSVQVGSFVAKRNAKALKNDLEKRFGGVYITPFKTVNQTFYRVRIKAKDHKDARSIALRLMESGYSAIVLEEQ
jgi:rare lipoprotein A